MTFIPTPQGVKVELNYSLGGLPAANVIWVDVNTAVTPALVEAVADSVGNWFETNLIAVMANDISLVNVIATDGSTQEGTQSIYTGDLPSNGSVASASLPGNVACVATWRTGFTGRSARGRIFLPGVPEIAVVQNTIQPAYLVNYGESLNALLEAVNTDVPGAFVAVNSFYTGGVARTAGRMLQVETVTLRAKVGTMRGRLE